MGVRSAVTAAHAVEAETGLTDGRAEAADAARSEWNCIIRIAARLAAMAPLEGFTADRAGFSLPRPR